jgi:hypothetical protein
MAVLRVNATRKSSTAQVIFKDQRESEEFSQGHEGFGIIARAKRQGLMSYAEVRDVASRIREVTDLWKRGNDSAALDQALETFLKEEEASN